MADYENRELWPGWKTVRLIGRGSYGAVYEIERDVFGHIEKAALKFMTIPQNESDIDELINDGYDEKSITARFMEYLQDIVREYTMMAEMKGCANIVYCDDLKYIQHSNGMGWDILIKMELLEPVTRAFGKDVSDGQVIKFTADICNALSYCEKRNVLHRDIKPQNIFVSQDGTYKLGDFGIAKTADHTTSGTKTGTYKYMAPEVYNNQPYGTKADIYSLGLVLYWLLNERRTPFLPLPPQTPTAADEDGARMRRLSGEKIPAPAHGSDSLKRIVLKACAYDQNDRYQNAEEMLKDILLLEKNSRGTEYSYVPDKTETVYGDERIQSIPRHKPAGQAAARGSSNKQKKTAAESKPKHSDKKMKNSLPVILPAVLIVSIAVAVMMLKGKFESSAEVQNETVTSEESSGSDTVSAGQAEVGDYIVFGSYEQDNDTAEVQDETVTSEESSGSDAVSAGQAEVGDYIVFGSYEQDNDTSNGKEEIRWLVLAKEDDRILVISDKALDCQPYNTSWTRVTWETCTLREWLNGTFLDAAFITEEKAMIQTARVSADKNPDYSTDPGNATTDKVFLLSINEANKYFSGDEARKCVPTAYAIAQGAYANSNYTKGGKATCWWWLRSPGNNQNNAALVDLDGSVISGGSSVHIDYDCVRPALWINLES